MRVYFIIEKNSQQSGPFTLEQINQKKLSPDTPIWYEGLKDWTILSNISASGEVISTNLPPKYLHSQPKASQVGYALSFKKAIIFFLIVVGIGLGYYLFSQFQIKREFSSTINLYKEKDSFNLKSIESLYSKKYGKAALLLGNYYFREDDTVQAAKYYSDAIEYGEKLLGNMGVALLKTNDERKKWFTENIDELKKEADDNNNWYVQNILGKIYYRGDILEKDYDQSFLYIKKAAENNSIKSQYLLGNFYMNGIGAKVNEKESFKWYKISAENGSSDAQNALGYLYQEGKGTEKNTEEAIKWYRASAERGNPAGQASLGTCYLYGKGVQIDLKEALKWYQIAAEKGDTSAQDGLAGMYLRGDGVKENKKLAITWYKRSAENGSTFAALMLRYFKMVDNLFNSLNNTYYSAPQSTSSDSYVTTCQWCGRSFTYVWRYGDGASSDDYCSLKCRRESGH
jgi:TPR repeat protein